MMLSSKEIQKIIPHRWPFLLVDKIIELEPGKRVVGIKNVTGGEFCFQGHFPDYPIFPGVLIIEALAQAGAVAALSVPEHKGKLVLFAGVDKLRFRSPVFPGDSLRLEVNFIRMRGNIGKATASATIEDKTVADGEILFAIADVEDREGSK